MKKQILLLLGIVCHSFLFSQNLNTQVWNGADYAVQQLTTEYSSFTNSYQNFQQNTPSFSQITTSPNQSAFVSPPILTIPVVVHVIHDGSTPVGEGENITYDRIQSQLNRLTLAFRNNNPNFANTPVTFQAAAADAEIEFCLAQIDPTNAPTSGIVRHTYSTSNITSISFIETIIKPATQWNPANYLNIWVVEMPNTSVLGGIQGYAYPPILGFAGVSPLDGVVIDYRFFGVGNDAIGEGVACIREVGRYLGLPNIWGANNVNGLPQGCSSDDGITDTPNQSAPTGMEQQGCPSSIPTSCSSNNMYVNYMDYLKDQSCQTMFTQGQATVMRAVLTGLAGAVGYGDRSTLVTNSLTACNSTCSVTLTTSFTSHACSLIPNGTATATASGGTAPYTYTWGTIPSQSTSTATGLRAGQYEVTVTDALGCQALSVVTVDSTMTLTASVVISPETCVGEDGQAVITPSGGTAPYNMGWLTPSGIQLGNTATSLSGGYTLATVADAVGCIYTDTVYTPLDCQSICDTFYPDLSTLSPSYYQNLYNYGFLAGSSLYNDLAKADYFNYSGNNTHITGGILAFYFAGGTGNIEVVIWDNVNGAPGAELGSTFIPISHIDTTLPNPIFFEFDAPIAVSNEFYLGVKIPNLASGDTIALVTTTIGQIPNELGRAWEQWSDGTWHSYSDSWNVEMGHAIVPILVTPPIADFDFDNITTCDSSAAVTFNNLSINSSDFTWTLTGADTVSPIAISPSVTYSTAGIYDATLIASNGCVSDTLVYPNAVTVNDCATGCGLYAVLIDTSATVSCFGYNDGTASVIPLNGTAPYTILWDNGNTNATANNLSGGIHTVTITDANGCIVVGTVEVEEPSAWQIAMTSIDESCNLNDGQASVSVLSGAAPFTYAWNTTPVSTTATISNLTGGTYIVTVTDNAGCQLIDTTIVGSPNAVNVSIQNIQNVLCNGMATGAASINPSGGTYTYQWSNNTTNSSITNVVAGTYFVTITDASGCSVIDTAVITEPTSLNANLIQSVSPTCNGASDGLAIIAGVGGTAPYTYLWSNNTTSDTLSNVSGGAYSFTITDANGCIFNSNISITQPNSLTIPIQTITNASCANTFDGSISVIPSGGTSPYTYLWSNNAVTPIVSNLSQGTYYLTVTDDNGCTTTDSMFVNGPPAIIVTVNTSPVNCAGFANGSAFAIVSGGVGGFTYLWDGTQGGVAISGLSAGNHLLVVTDQNGCQETVNFTIGTLPGLNLDNLTTNNVSCFGANDGSASALISGGTPPYAFAWNSTPIQTSSTATNLAPGAYTLSVTDAFGCPMTPATFSITQPTELVVGATINIDPLCNDTEDGSIEVIAIGGTPSYQYFWSNGDNGMLSDSLGGGTYTVTVVDANNCQTIRSETLTPPLPLSAIFTPTHTSCFGENDGSIEVASVAGGIAPYTYAVRNNLFQSIDFITPSLIADNYLVTVQDDNGCTIAANVEIEQPSQIEVSVGDDIETVLGTTIQLEANINTIGVALNWTTTDSSISCTTCYDPTITATESQNYILTVTDSSGCSSSDSLFILVVKDRRIFIPTGFSPNNDSYNDKLIVYGGTGVEEILSFRVFDRWGELLHEASNFAPGSENHGWDGRLRNKLMPSGIYVISVHARFTDGLTHVYTSDVTLIRY